MIRHRWEKVEGVKGIPEFRCVRPGCDWQKILVRNPWPDRYAQAEYFVELAGKRFRRAPVCGANKRQVTIGEFLEKNE